MQIGSDVPAMVVSHERSGTHFLMNTLALEFGYRSDRIIPLDYNPVNINYHNKENIRDFFVKNKYYKPNYLRKCHHEYSFFQGIIGEILNHIRIYYIYRDPREVLHSLRHYLNAWSWFEGPKTDCPSSFIRMAPAGAMMRFQYYQRPDMVDRWRVHVEGWLEAAETYPQIIVVKYEELRDRYDQVVDAIAQDSAEARLYGGPPEMDKLTILKSKAGAPSDRYTDEDLDHFRKRAGATMRRLGYEI